MRLSIRFPRRLAQDVLGLNGAPLCHAPTTTSGSTAQRRSPASRASAVRCASARKNSMFALKHLQPVGNAVDPVPEFFRVGHLQAACLPAPPAVCFLSCSCCSMFVAFVVRAALTTSINADGFQPYCQLFLTLYLKLQLAFAPSSRSIVALRAAPTIINIQVACNGWHADVWVVNVVWSARRAILKSLRLDLLFVHSVLRCFVARRNPAQADRPPSGRHLARERWASSFFVRVPRHHFDFRESAVRHQRSASCFCCPIVMDAFAHASTRRSQSFLSSFQVYRL